jgi:hypothetical protein
MKYYGCDELREWLVEQGFRVYTDTLARDTGCNWYACRRSTTKARACECNGDKGGMTLLVRPWSIADPSRSELRQRLPDIEAALVRAWNALV